MATRSISFTDHHDNLIEEKLNSGQYQNVSEVVRDAMRALEQREAEELAKLDALRSAVNQGMDAYERGDFVTFKSGKEVGDYLADQAKNNS
ncbi:MAG: type II toxin-antitoxin system ParD family antitoxin [Pseudomonadota bacterium]